jgi:hypothetical protein
MSASHRPCGHRSLEIAMKTPHPLLATLLTAMVAVAA